MRNVFLLGILAISVSSCQNSPSINERERKPTSIPKYECSLIDSDLAIDDIRAIALITPQFKKNIIVATEGMTRTYYGTKIAEKIIQSSSTPLEASIFQGKTAQQTFLATWLTEQREIHETMNSFLPMRIPANTPYTIEQPEFISAIKDCKKIHVFLLAPYTSFASYKDLIKRKTKSLIVYGKPTKEPKNSYFNCYYDADACVEFSEASLKPKFVQLPEELKTEFQIKPSTIDDLDTRGLQGLVKSVHLAETSSWQNDKALMWDDSAALFFLNPTQFKKVNDVYVPNMKPDEFRKLWAESMRSNL